MMSQTPPGHAEIPARLIIASGVHSIWVYEVETNGSGRSGLRLVQTFQVASCPQCETGGSEGDSHGELEHLSVQILTVLSSINPESWILASSAENVERLLARLPEAWRDRMAQPLVLHDANPPTLTTLQERLSTRLSAGLSF
jgi:hypothetical protein